MLFASDLDNTLIFSYKTAAPGSVCVEHKDGKELSFMTPAAHRLLRELSHAVSFVPITTRSLEQYRRIRLPAEGPRPRLAMTANGGVLLIDGEPEPGFLAETKRIVRHSMDELGRGAELLSKSGPRLVDELFVFAKPDDMDGSEQLLRRFLDPGLVTVRRIGAKLYILPSAMHKGLALSRLRDRLGGVFTVSAGDSVMDRPMLSHSDLALYSLERGTNRMCFSELVLETVMRVSEAYFR